MDMIGITLQGTVPPLDFENYMTVSFQHNSHSFERKLLFFVLYKKQNQLSDLGFPFLGHVITILQFPYQRHFSHSDFLFSYINHILVLFRKLFLKGLS